MTPVELLIGWEWSPDLACWVERLDGQTGAGHGRAEADDLAAWLTTRTTWLIDHERGRFIIHTFGEDRPPAWYPTIRDALVAAVRRVAEQ